MEEGTKIEMICKICKNKFFIWICRVRLGRGKFCSSKCYYESRRDKRDLNIIFEDKIDKTDGCWLWKGGKVSSGYGRFKYFGESFSAHRLSWVLFRGSIPNGKFILHKCNNPICVNPDHLYIGDQFQNMQDRKINHKYFSGESHFNAKFTNKEVMSIRNLYAEGMGSCKIGKMYQVNRSTILRIAKERTYQNVKEEV
jgi:hypothetical protein